MKKIDKVIEVIAKSADRLLEDIGDYIWKCPRFIEMEESIEIEKLSLYFPPSEDPIEQARSNVTKALRWRYEEHKLKNVFPDVMAKSNLFSVLSYFEFYCLQLYKETQNTDKDTVLNFNENGIKMIFSYFQKFGIKTESICFRPQLMASLKIRNCLVHANGVMLWIKKDQDELRRILKTGEYWCRADGTKSKDKDGVVKMISGPFGDQIVVENLYAYMVSHYARKFFLELCSQVLSKT